MTIDPMPNRIPLLRISGVVNQEGRKDGILQGLIRVSEVDVPENYDLPEHCYALKMPDIVKESIEPGNFLGIFGPGKDCVALKDIYVLGIAGREPIVCKVIKNDAHSGTSIRGEFTQAISSSSIKKRRKSFMTPTPLHIPESRVSPIPDSSHEMIYLKDLTESKGLKVVPLRDVLWMHPLMTVIEAPEK